MKEIIYNKDNLSDNEMTELVKRVKVLMINSNDEILLGYSHNDYQFPGGHVEKGESLTDAVKREVREEAGILLSNIDDYFVKSIGYYKDWPKVGSNRKIEIYYYVVKTDELPNLDNTCYTKSELEGGFELRYIPLSKVEDELLKNKNVYGDKKGITKEMLEIFKIYKDMHRKELINFRQLLKTDFKLMYHWSQKRIVYEWFEQRKLSYDEIVDKYTKKLNNKENLYIINCDNKDIGFTQIYKYHDNLDMLKEYNNIYEYDLFIGYRNYIGKGIGTKIVNKINDEINSKYKPNYILLRPFSRNKKAINCYIKCGFKVIGNYLGKDTLGNDENITVMIKEFYDRYFQ